MTGYVASREGRSRTRIRDADLVINRVVAVNTSPDDDDSSNHIPIIFFLLTFTMMTV